MKFYNKAKTFIFTRKRKQGSFPSPQSLRSRVRWEEELTNVFSDSNERAAAELRKCENRGRLLWWFSWCGRQKKGKGKNCFHIHFPCWHKRERKLNELWRRVLCSCSGLWRGWKKVYFLSFQPVLPPTMLCMRKNHFHFLTQHNCCCETNSSLDSPLARFVYISLTPALMFWLEYHGVDFQNVSDFNLAKRLLFSQVDNENTSASSES